MSTIPVDISLRDVLRCGHCFLVQFRTVSGLCRKCAKPLPLPPQFEAAPLLSPNAAQSRGRGHHLSSAGALDRPGFQPRGKTARELTIGRKLRELREQRHLTQQQMAGKAGVPRTYISRIENARLLPGPVMLNRIADALAVAIFDLLPQTHSGGNSPVMEDDHYWTTLANHFLQLQPSDMAYVVSHARDMLSDRRPAAFVQAVAVT